MEHEVSYRKIYLVHIRVLLLLYHINADECTSMLVKHHFIRTLYHSDMFQPLKGHMAAAYHTAC